MKQEQSEFVISGMMAFISLFVIFMIRDYPYRSKFFPTIVALILLALALYHLFDSIRKYNLAASVKETISLFPIKVIIVFILCCLYLFFVPRAGYYLTTFLFLIISFIYLGIKTRNSLIITLCILIFIFGFFQTILGLSFPQGIFL